LHKKDKMRLEQPAGISHFLSNLFLPFTFNRHCEVISTEATSPFIISRFNYNIGIYLNFVLYHTKEQYSNYQSPFGSVGLEEKKA